MNPIRLLRRLRRHQEGATAVEFAIVGFMFFMLMFGIIEYGMIMLTKVAIESAVMQVSRATSLGTLGGNDPDTNIACIDRVCTARWLVRQRTLGLLNSQAVRVTGNVISAAATASPRVPDICLGDPADPYPTTCPTGSNFINNDGIPGYQSSATALSGGGAGDLVEIRVTYLWRVLFPMFEIFQPQADAGGQRGFLVITSSAVIKNEPFTTP